MVLGTTTSNINIIIYFFYGKYSKQLRCRLLQVNRVHVMHELGKKNLLHFADNVGPDQYAQSDLEDILNSSTSSFRRHILQYP